MGYSEDPANSSETGGIEVGTLVHLVQLVHLLPENPIICTKCTKCTTPENIIMPEQASLSREGKRHE
jgi:hypothetical protein